METQTKINGAIAAIILLIAGYTVVGDTAQNPTHYCEEREIKAFCYSLSSTMKTCYTEMNKTGGKRCGLWKEIGNVESTTIPTVSGEKWLCPPRTDSSECVKINSDNVVYEDN